MSALQKLAEIQAKNEGKSPYTVTIAEALVMLAGEMDTLRQRIDALNEVLDEHLHQEGHWDGS